MRSRDSMAGNTRISPGHVPSARWPEALRIAFWLMLGMAVFFLAIEHRVHLMARTPWLPYLLLAACPLLHWFGYGGHARRPGASPTTAPPQADTHSRKSGE